MPNGRPSLDDIFGTPAVAPPPATAPVRPSLDDIFGAPATPPAPIQGPMQQIPTPAHPIPEAPQVSITPDQLYLPQTGQESEERAYDMLHDVYRRLEEDPQNEQLRTAYEQASKQYQEAIPGFARAGEPLAEYVTRPLARAAKSVAAGTLGTLGDIGGMAGDVAVDIGETVANIPSKALEMLGAEGVAEATRIELPRFKSDTSEWIRQSFDIGTGGLTKPRSATERIADLAGETVAGSFAFQPIASGMKAAGASPAVASAIEGMTPQSVKGMVSATNAGIGAGAAREAFPDNPYAELVGGLLGGFSVDMPAELMKSKVVKKIGDVVRKVAKGGTVEDVLERTGLIGTRAERYAKQLEIAKQDGRVKWLSEIDEEVGDLARELRTKSPAARRILEKRFANRTKKEADRISEMVNENLTGKGYYENIDDIDTMYAKVTQPLYERGFKAPDVDDDRIAFLLQTDDTIKKANQQAQRIIQQKRTAMRLANQNVRVRNVTATDPEVLEMTNRVINNDVLRTHRASEFDPRIVTEEGRAIEDARRALLAALDENIPELNAARKMQSDKFALLRAQKFAHDTIGKKTSPEQIKRMIAEYSPAEAEAALVGIANKIKELSDTAVQGGSSAKKVIGQIKKQKQLEPFFTKEMNGKRVQDTEKYKKFIEGLEDEISANASFNRIFRDSATQPRQQFTDEIKTKFWNFKRMTDLLDVSVGKIAGGFMQRYSGLTKKNAMRLARAITSQEESAKILAAMARDLQQNPRQRELVQNAIRNMVVTMPEGEQNMEGATQ